MPRLALLDDDLQAPKWRSGTPAETYNYVEGIIQADDLRAQYRTHIDGLVGGNAPYCKSKRDRTNLNFRQATAIINQIGTPYYDLFCEVPLLYEVETTFGNSEERSDWSQIISEEFDRGIKDWDDWEDTMQQMIRQMITHNIGHLYWEDNLDWRPQPALINEILVADQSPCRLSKLEAVIIRKGYLVTELMSMIQDEKKARDLGWHPEAVKQAVREAYRGQGAPPDQSNQWEWYERKRRNSDLYFGEYECDRVWAAHLLVREFNNGGISNQIIRTDQQTNEFLFQRAHEFEDLDEAICPFFYDIGNGSWHSGKGVGTEIYAYCQIFNRLRCREVDAAMIAASVLVQAKDGNAAKAAQMLTLDNLKILPENVTFMEHAIGQNLSATIDVRHDMEQGMIQNIGALMKAPGSPNPRKGQKQAILEMQQAAQLGKGKINSFYGYDDRLGRQMFKKITNPKLRAHHPGGPEALAFRARCYKRGVPPQALLEIDFVKAYRSVGAGSAANAIMITEMLMELAPSLKEPGREALFRLYISRLAGARTADMLVGPVKTGDKKTDQDWQASVENKMLRQGADGKTFLADDQNDVIHARSHIEDEEQHLQQMEQIASQRELTIQDLQPVYIHLESAGPHSYDHLQRFKNDPIREKDYAELNKQWMQIARMADQIKQNLDQMIEEQQRQQEAQQQPQGNAELLKNIQYDKAPESVKMQVEAAAGTPRQPGDMSVSAKNMQIKEANTTLKAAKQKEQSVVTDIDLAQQTQKHQKDMAQPMKPAPAQ